MRVMGRKKRGKEGGRGERERDREGEHVRGTREHIWGGRGLIFWRRRDHHFIIRKERASIKKLDFPEKKGE